MTKCRGVIFITNQQFIRKYLKANTFDRGIEHCVDRLKAVTGFLQSNPEFCERADELFYDLVKRETVDNMRFSRKAKHHERFIIEERNPWDMIANYILSSKDAKTFDKAFMGDAPYSGYEIEPEIRQINKETIYVDKFSYYEQEDDDGEIYSKVNDVPCEGFCEFEGDTYNAKEAIRQLNIHDEITEQDYIDVMGMKMQGYNDKEIQEMMCLSRQQYQTILNHIKHKLRPNTGNADNKLVVKVCSTCHKKLPFTEFSKNKSTKDGRSHICKVCDRNRKRKQKLNSTNKNVA